VELWQMSGVEPDDPRENLGELLAWVRVAGAFLRDRESRLEAFIRRGEDDDSTSAA
jgi:hypothetical protein